MSISSNPYYTIWFKPKATIDGILSNKIKFQFPIPILLMGFSSLLGELKDENGLGMQFSIVLVVFGIGIFFLMIGYFFPWIVLKTGKIWKGKGEFRDLQAIFSLAQIPFIIILVNQIVNILFGQIVGIEQVNYLVLFIAWIFYMRILIIGIARAQGFSFGTALLNFVISVLPLFIVRLILGVN